MKPPQEVTERYDRITERVARRDSYLKSFAIQQFTIALARLFRESGLKQHELARAVGVRPPYISKVFRGNENLGIGTMAKLASALGAAVHIHLAKKGVRVHWTELDPETDTGRETSGAVAGAGASLRHIPSAPLETHHNLVVRCISGSRGVRFRRQKVGSEWNITPEDAGATVAGVIAGRATSTPATTYHQDQVS